MRGSRLVRLGAAVAAGVLAIGPGGPAYAADTIDINPSHRNIPAADFGAPNCDPNFGGGPYPGRDVWVFVLPQPNQLGEFTSITITFNTPNGPVNLTIPDADDSGIAEDNGASKAWIITTAGWTISDASANITGEATEDPNGRRDTFNLTHTCPASSTPGPTNTPPTADVTTPAVVTPSGAPETGGGGGQETGNVALGAGAIVLAGAAGIGLIAVARRRRADG
ncbi:hypothetical protein Pa4123_76150 [Phytohabitans aurantiacus]|uniref:Gram-positive cocci surface proteins LPxTG domain-containing protein n=1 Tax=Phytohabitans aurantiacus TaxID=3016789 RepID=A0ABQ5R8X8_9ACTN|nr:hypothetical protein Pa4123_76150 [Phytohabitans aurantiacus]